MSFEPVNWATKCAPIASTTEYAVLVAYSIHANSGGYNTYPSYPTVARYTQLNPETVKRTVQALVRRKLMEKGDQRLVAHIPANARPVAYNVRVPASFYGTSLPGINAELKEMGFPPITSATRPDIEAAPTKKRRADAKPKGEAEEFGGDYKSPPGGTSSDPRGELQDPPGGDYESPQTSKGTSKRTSEGTAPAARSATNGRRPGAGRTRASGSAAFGTIDAATRDQAARLVASLQADVLELIADRRPVEQAAAEALLRGDRTPMQLSERARDRWVSYGYRLRAHDGTLANPTGAAISLWRPGVCPDPRCDDGTNVDSGRPCGHCETRRADRRAGTVPAARTAPAAAAAGRKTCPGCERSIVADGPELCVDCAAELTRAAERFGDYEVDTEVVDEVLRELDIADVTDEERAAVAAEIGHGLSVGATVRTIVDAVRAAEAGDLVDVEDPGQLPGQLGVPMPTAEPGVTGD